MNLKFLFLAILSLFSLSHKAMAGGEIKQVPFTDWRPVLCIVGGRKIAY